DTFDEKQSMESTDTTYPFFIEIFANFMVPKGYSNNLIYIKKDVKFELNKDNKISQITSVDKRLDKLNKKQLSNYFGKPTLEWDDYVVYEVGDYQLLFQF
ncbi:DUF4309 domain-containing protein, partial [Bacillus sp. JJ664]